MKTYYREQINTLNKRLNEKRKFIQVITGPRQVGKTTLVLQLLDMINVPNYYVSADGIITNDKLWIEEQWQTARLKFKQAGTKDFIFVIDEIQKINNWSEYIKKEWDSDTRLKNDIKLVLLGSSRLLLEKGLSESLTGRFELLFTGHWLYHEMHDAFGLCENEYAWFGGYPGSVELINDEKRWKWYVIESIIETTISRDIMMLTRVDKPALLRRLFELGCLYSGQILSYNKILGQLQDSGNTTTLAHYLNLLDAAGLVAGIEKYSIQKIRQRHSSPKFIVYNTGLVSSQSDNTFEEITKYPEKWGRVVETAIGSHLINYSLIENFKLFYWRAGNDEMDFVITNKNRVIGIEVKSSGKRHNMRFDNFNKLVKPDKVYLIDDSGISWREFLKINPLELF